MIRPCFLVIDRETSSSISTRKLILETAKFNVITAYSSDEAIQTLKKYPALDGIVADAVMTDLSCEELVDALKDINPTIPIVVIASPRCTPSKRADHVLESFDPRKLLGLLQSLFPEATIQIEKRNEDLEDRYHKVEGSKQ
jgi:CheY-like chemotaxis protein